MSQATPEAIGEWMADRVKRVDRLRQRAVAREIAETFGEEFTYKNKNGNRAIDSRVLKAFRSITGDTVIWSPRGRYWRKRESGDARTRSQPRRAAGLRGEGESLQAVGAEHPVSVVVDLPQEPTGLALVIGVAGLARPCEHRSGPPLKELELLQMPPHAGVAAAAVDARVVPVADLCPTTRMPTSSRLPLDTRTTPSANMSA